MSDPGQPSLSEQYTRQSAFRHWQHVFDVLPSLEGQRVFDLGCAVGEQAKLLAGRGAQVVGVDSNEALLSVARARQIPGATFELADISRVDHGGVYADGLWCSFAAAYFVDPSLLLRHFRKLVRPGGWVAVIEADDVFGHEPLTGTSRALLDAFADDAARSGRYDFRTGRKLSQSLAAAGFRVTHELALEDEELAFQGVAGSDVLEAWRARFDRMDRLQAFCGDRFSAVRNDFLQCLLHREHSCSARVLAVVAVAT